MMIQPIQSPRSSASASWAPVNGAGAESRAIGIVTASPSTAAIVVLTRPLAIAPITVSAGRDHRKYIMGWTPAWLGRVRGAGSA
ncbi:hypothetical protein D3C86_1197940 [compost metagenome]